MANIRASELTHHRLKQLSHSTGQPIQTVLDRAIEAYRRTVFLEQLNEDYAKLRVIDSEWSEELADRKDLEGTLYDGLMRSSRTSA